MKTRLILTSVLAALIGFSVPAIAGNGSFAKHHPRRAEVNHRIARQDHRVATKVKDGKMSKKRAAKLVNNDRKVRKEERAMASQNKGHITKKEKIALNQQLNRNSKKIHR